ncbi:MAG TPA: hypothetical protein VGG73_18895 [Vicinamibacterales bacterium]
MPIDGSGRIVNAGGGGALMSMERNASNPRVPTKFTASVVRARTCRSMPAP